jgi:NAD(P)H-dependent FMN reductase
MSAEPIAEPLKVAIISGSTRPGRKSEAVAGWVQEIAAKRDDAVFEIVDLADQALPLLDEPIPPMAGRYMNPHTQKWAATIAAFDAFVFVTPEYNRSTSGALKNAVDYLFAEWNDKAAGFVSYGFAGGIRAVEHLRVILSELKVATVRTSVGLMFGEDFEGFTTFAPRESQTGNVVAMLDEVVTWGKALKSVRAEAAPA